MQFKMNAGQIPTLRLSYMCLPHWHRVLLCLLSSVLGSPPSEEWDSVWRYCSFSHPGRKTSIHDRRLVTVCCLNRVENGISLEEYWQLSITCRILIFKWCCNSFPDRTVQSSRLWAFRAAHPLEWIRRPTSATAGRLADLLRVQCLWIPLSFPPGAEILPDVFT